MVLDPRAAVVVHPNMNGLLPADVVPGFLGLNPLEFHNFLPLFEEEFPNLGIGIGLGRRGDGLGGGWISQIALEIIEGRDGKFEELGQFLWLGGRQRGHGGGRLREVFEKGDGEFAALGEIMLGQPDEVATAADAQIFGPVVNLRQDSLGQRNADGGLVFGSFLHNKENVAFYSVSIKQHFVDAV